MDSYTTKAISIHPTASVVFDDVEKTKNYDNSNDNRKWNDSYSLRQ